LGNRRGQNDEMSALVWWSKNERGREKKKGKRVATLEEEKIIRWAIDDKEDWGREEEIEENHRKIEEMVPKKFLK